jgi:Transposase IS66 family
LNEALRQYVMSGRKLHADDTPVPVLAPGQGKTKQGRLWTYIRDDRRRERTWQAWAWEANARVAIAEPDLEKARHCITKALLLMESWEIPLAAWRVHSTAAELSDHMGTAAWLNTIAR